MSDWVRRTTADRGFYLMVLSLFAVSAVFLAAVGIHGLMSYSVFQRHREIGIRLALAGAAGDILGLFLRNGIALAVVGVAFGTLASLTLSRALTGLLYDLSPSDPLTLAATALVFLVVAAISSFVPAQRATRVDPNVALRSE